jgi:hypothetical protein
MTQCCTAQEKGSPIPDEAGGLLLVGIQAHSLRDEQEKARGYESRPGRLSGQLICGGGFLRRRRAA